jgi:hypothetical protein
MIVHFLRKMKMSMPLSMVALATEMYQLPALSSAKTSLILWIRLNILRELTLTMTTVSSLTSAGEIFGSNSNCYTRGVGKFGH